jgi:hypothetical protein
VRLEVSLAPRSLIGDCHDAERRPRCPRRSCKYDRQLSASGDRSV